MTFQKHHLVAGFVLVHRTFSEILPCKIPVFHYHFMGVWFFKDLIVSYQNAASTNMKAVWLCFLIFKITGSTFTDDTD